MRLCCMCFAVRFQVDYAYSHSKQSSGLVSSKPMRAMDGLQGAAESAVCKWPQQCCAHAKQTRRQMCKQNPNPLGCSFACFGPIPERQMQHAHTRQGPLTGTADCSPVGVALGARTCVTPSSRDSLSTTWYRFKDQSASSGQMETRFSNRSLKRFDFSAHGHACTLLQRTNTTRSHMDSRASAVGHHSHKLAVGSKEGCVVQVHWGRLQLVQTTSAHV